MTGYPRAIYVFLLLAVVSSECCGTLHKRGHTIAPQTAGTAYISELDGNVKDAGDHFNVSGTNVWVRMYVKDSWADNVHLCYPYLGDSILAGYFGVKVNPGFELDMQLKTGSSGQWQSQADKGYVKFDTTDLLGTGTEGSLRVRLSPWDKTPFFSKWEGMEKPVRLYNKAYVLSNTSILWGSTAANYVHAKCEAVNNSASPLEAENETHDKEAILASLPTYTVFYMCTHGNNEGQPYFFDCLDWFPGPTEVVNASDVDVAVDTKTVQPHYNLVHLDACYSSSEKHMAQAFEILDASFQARPDQAFIGWVGVSVSWPGTLNWTKEVWDLLGQGFTMKYAVDQASLEHGEIGLVRVYGDYNTTLHKVYGGVIDPAP